MLTDSIIKSAIKSAPGAGRRQTVLTDRGARGEGRLTLVVRVTPSRVSAEWYATYWREGSRRLVKMGIYPAMSLADARAKFREEYAPAIQSGSNPKNPYVRRNNRATKRPASVRELFESYVKHLKANRGEEAAYQADRILVKREGAAAIELGQDRPARDITAADVVALLSTIYERGTPGQADATRSYVRSAFAWGMTAAHDYRKQVQTADWGITANPGRLHPQRRRGKHARLALAERGRIQVLLGVAARSPVAIRDLRRACPADADRAADQGALPAARQRL